MAGQLDQDTRQKQVLQELVETVFSEKELDRFCARHFPNACPELAVEGAMAVKVRRLIDYAGRQNLLGHLAALVDRVEPEATRQFVQRRRSAAGQTTHTRQAEKTRKTVPVKAGARFRSRLRPKVVASGGVVRVMVQNLGHEAETFVVQPQPAPGLVFQPGRRRLKLAAGKSGAAGFRVSFRRRLIGRSRSQNFSLLVASPRAAAVTLNGSVAGRSLLASPWLAAAALLASLLVVIITVFYSTVYSSPMAVAATANLQAGQATARAATVQAFLTRTAPTATPTPTAAPRREQIEAATATAIWLAEDADGDGLANGEELSLGTDPYVRDTDRDGLDDGEEVERFLTNPLNPDSDYDGKLDGEEVRLGLNPTLQDTDGDGIPDALDLDPGPTATPAVPYSGGPGAPRLGFSSAYYVIDERESEAMITVLLDRPASQVVSVDYSTRSGTAEAGSDYRTTAGTLVFNPGETKQRFTVPIIDDTVDEPDELLHLSLANPRGVTLANNQARLTILDDDEPLSLRFSQGSRLLGQFVSGPVPVYQVNESQGRVIIDVVLSAPAAELIRVNYATNDGTATAGQDYHPTRGSLFFDPGVDRRTFELVLINDRLPEPNELVILTLSNASGARIDTPLAELIIVDDDF